MLPPGAVLEWARVPWGRDGGEAGRISIFRSQIEAPYLRWVSQVSRFSYKDRERGKHKVPPLRFAPVAMTDLFTGICATDTSAKATAADRSVRSTRAGSDVRTFQAPLQVLVVPLAVRLPNKFKLRHCPSLVVVPLPGNQTAPPPKFFHTVRGGNRVIYSTTARSAENEKLYSQKDPGHHDLTS